MTELITWPGTFAGFAIGLYAVLQLKITGNPLGCSMSYGNVCAFTTKTGFFQTIDFEQPNNWRLWFILGIIPGGFLASITSNGFEGYQFSMEMGKYYDTMLPDNTILKSLILFTGGTLLGLGARIANGCTSGHAIAGIAFLNLNSIILALLFMLSAVITGNLIFHNYSLFFN